MTQKEFFYPSVRCPGCKDGNEFRPPDMTSEELDRFAGGPAVYVCPVCGTAIWASDYVEE